MVLFGVENSRVVLQLSLNLFFSFPNIHPTSIDPSPKPVISVQRSLTTKLTLS